MSWKIISGIVLIVMSTTFGRVGDILEKYETPGPKPTGLAFDGENLWLTDAFTDKIYAIDAKSGKVIRQFETPGCHPEGLAWDGKHLWHTDSGESIIYKLDPETGSAVLTLESSTKDPRDIAWDGKHLWVADHKKDVILKVSPGDGMALNFFKAPAKEVTGLAFDGKYLWVADRIEDRIYLVNPDDGLCVSSLRSYGPFPTGLAWGGQTLWNIDYQNRQIYKIKVFDQDILTRWDKRSMELYFVKEFRNYGPGVVDNLDVYLPIPIERDNQKFLGPVEFDRKPDEIINDQWDQKIARFSYKNLTGYNKVLPGWKVKADIFATEYFIYPDKVGSIDDVPQTIRDKYTADAEKFLIHDPYIEKLANNIAPDEKNPYWIARRTLEYLTENLSYNLKPIGGWNPAPMALKRGTASCSEYSYCMIALCRNRGVPIRYVGAVSRRGDDSCVDNVFHRWVEVYLPPYGWIPFDANKADKPLPGNKALGVGNVSARYIITTANGGGGNYLKYGYNYGYQWSGTGKCRIHEENYGFWSALGEKVYNEPNK